MPPGRKQKVMHCVPLMDRVTSLYDLEDRARTDPQYEKLAKVGSSNLGGPSDTLDAALRYLRMSAAESDSEEGVVDEVNFVRDCVK